MIWEIARTAQATRTGETPALLELSTPMALLIQCHLRLTDTSWLMIDSADRVVN